jgi:hypothetical protein
MLTPNLAAYLNLRLEKTFFPRKIRVGFVVADFLLGLFLFSLPCVTLTPIFHTHIRPSINIQNKRSHFQRSKCNIWGYAVAQLVEALRYKPEGRGFDSQWISRLGFFIDIILPAALWSWA